MSAGDEFDHSVSTLARTPSGHIAPESANCSSKLVGAATVLRRHSCGHCSSGFKVAMASSLESANTVAVTMQTFPLSARHCSARSAGAEVKKMVISTLSGIVSSWSENQFATCLSLLNG